MAHGIKYLRDPADNEVMRCVLRVPTAPWETMDSDKEFFEELKREFLVEASFLLEQGEASCLALEDEARRKDALDEVFRVYHSVKGGAAAVGLTDLAEFGHAVENCLSILRSDPDRITAPITNLLFRANDALKIRLTELRKNEGGPWEIQALVQEFVHASEDLQKDPKQGRPAAVAHALEHEIVSAESEKSTVRVSTETIDSVLDLIGELVVIKSQLMHGKVFEGKKSVGLDSLMTLLDKTVRELQDKALHMRMTPLKSVFMRAQRQVRELSQTLKKPTRVTISGDSTEIDRDLIELIGDPLVHLIRNAMDHGIESEQERVQAGKPAQASLEVSARQVRGRILIEIKDDGRGIDRNRVIEKARERQLIGQDVDGDALTDEEVFGLLFLPGFSTKSEITDLSGRGVGLDVVKNNIEKMKGVIEIESQVGTGTSFRLSIPLTAAIFDGMVVMVGENYYILPLEKIIEISDSRRVERMSAGDQVLAQYGDELIPLIHLESAFSAIPAIDQAALLDKESAIGMSDVVVTVQYYSQKLALQVKAVVGQVQVVVKPLGERFRNVPDVSGAAILGDGKIALIVDTDGVGRRLAIPTNKTLRGNGNNNGSKIASF